MQEWRSDGVGVIFLGTRPAQTKAVAASLTPHCLFFIITCGTIASVGQGAVRTPARAEQHRTDVI